MGIGLCSKMPDCLWLALSSLLGLSCLWLHLVSGLGGVTERKGALFGHHSGLFKNNRFAAALNLSLPTVQYSSALLSITELSVTYF